MEDCRYNNYLVPVSFSFFASVCLLAVEILLSISVLVIPDTVDSKIYPRVNLASCSYYASVLLCSLVLTWHMIIHVVFMCTILPVFYYAHL